MERPAVGRRGLAPAGAAAQPAAAGGEPRDAAAALRSALASPDAAGRRRSRPSCWRRWRCATASRAHVPWLRELPDPLTRVSWTRLRARSPPSAARALGVARRRRGGGARRRAARSSCRCACCPASTRASLGLPVGYGRADGDDGRPDANAFRLARLDGGGRLVAARPRRAASSAGAGPSACRSSSPTPRPRAARRGLPGRPRRRAASTSAHVPQARDLWPTAAQSAPQWHMVDRPRRLHRLQRLRRGLPGREQRRGGRPGRDAPATATCTGCGSTATSRATRERPTCSSSRCCARSATTRRARRCARWRPPCTARTASTSRSTTAASAPATAPTTAPTRCARFNWFDNEPTASRSSAWC